MTSAARRSFIFCLTALLFGSLAAAQSSAVVPRLVNFSGKAVDGGKVITGVAGATFAIYSRESGGSPLWLETQNIQADTKGNYTVQLGATKPDGLPLDLFTSGEARNMFVDNPQLIQETALRNSTLQGAYMILTARALGLDCGPMSGFDNAKLDEEFFAAGKCESCEQEFFPEGHVKSNFLCNIGYGDPSKLMPRGPRLDFVEAID